MHTKTLLVHFEYPLEQGRQFFCWENGIRLRMMGPLNYIFACKGQDRLYYRVLHSPHSKARLLASLINDEYIRELPRI